MQNHSKVEVFGEVPLARFGHTITQVSKSKVVLFGGATGDTGKYVITGDTYSFDLISNKWAKLEGSGIAPSPRAAHASCSVDTLQMVVYGGATGGGSLASDDLYLLDMRNGDQQAQWMIVPVVGSTPGRRYGHTIVYVKPYLLVFAGNTGNEAVNDTWCLNVDKAPFSWAKLETPGDNPVVRVYHSAALCSQGHATGMMVIFGGRTSDQNALKDTWGLRRHRNGSWDWVKAPYKPGTEDPSVRYQHTTLFVGTMMIVLGGRTNQPNEAVVCEVYDTETSEWRRFNCIQRFRHAVWTLDTYLYIHGGFENDQPNIPTNSILKLDLAKLLDSAPALKEKLLAVAGIQSQSSSGLSGSFNNGKGSAKTTEGGLSRSGTPTMSAQGKDRIKISKAEIVLNDGEKPRMLALNDLVDEKRKQGQVPSSQNPKQMGPGGKQQINSVDTLYSLFLNHLLRPREWQASLDGNGYFAFRREHIISLAEECQRILEEQPMVLRVDAPIKVFGDIHGQYQDLMRFFDLWGSPSEQGDIESYDYLFLGDYVDRGSHSLETICLLMALKVKYPDKIHLLRGNHEDKWINNAFGFAEECSNRLGEDPAEPDSVFQKINEVFDWLPLAALIDDKIVCLHGGIGSTLVTMDQIDKIARPLEVIHEVSTPEQQLVVDVLWSDPTDNDSEHGIQPNFIRDPNGTGNIVKFGPDRVSQFLENNRAKFILRAHECVMDGIERFAGGQLFTVFSATDYCGRHKNAGAMLMITKNFEIVPKMIYPLNGPNEQSNWLAGAAASDEDNPKKRPPTPPRWTNQGPRKSSYD